MRVTKFLFLLVLCASCARQSPVESVETQMNPIAERYVRLGLAMGEHDKNYVDAYFGPEEWRDAAKQQALSLEAITAAADGLVSELQALDLAGAENIVALRHNFLIAHLQALAAVSRARNGHVYSFDEESKAIYGFVAPGFPEEHYALALAELETLLPGVGPLHERYYAFNQQFRIPEDKLEAVVAKGIEECRARTLEHIALPDGEQYKMELVTGNPWGAYNWYQGNANSLIQVETGRPKYLGTSIRLGCHEGYPGHHTYSSMLDFRYGQGRGWVEYSMFPLYGPQGIIFEGSGNYAAIVAFPGSSRSEFLRNVIMPMTGIDSADIELQEQVRNARGKLRYADVEAARHYLDGDWSKDETISWLTTYVLVAPENIDAWFAFTERYRAYRINYVLGQDLVEAYVRRENPGNSADGNWQALEALLSLPPAPALFADR
jgi:hypothetical protein